MRRVKRLIIHEGLLTQLLSCCLLDCDSADCVYINVPIKSPLPECVKILSIDKDISRNTISVIIEHDSFDEVESGSEIPLYDGFDIECKVFKVSDLVEVDRPKWYNNII